MPDWTEMTDEQLVAAFRSGDLTALAILLKRYETPLRNFIHYLSGWRDETLVDDAFSEMVIAIYEGIKQGGVFIIGPEGSFSAWAVGVTKRKYFKASRNQRHAPIPMGEWVKALPAKPEHARYYDEPDELQELQSLENKLGDVLTGLSPERRQLWNLLQQGKSYEEIQQTPPFNNHSVGALRIKAHRLRQFIQNKLK
ncbi:MAG: hypothetical protein HY762_06690 [Planctomycetes bacterium]|nr:hypothetical protein [Planctomycetota bacterium]